MGVYIYRLTEDYKHVTGIKNREFENEWFKLEKDGTITIKGSNKNGYAWDGCSPKFKFKDVYFGIPEGVLNAETDRSKTYFASLVHDVLYQFAKDIRSIITRKEVDDEFLLILQRDKFSLAKVYHRVVRIVSWIFW